MLQGTRWASNAFAELTTSEHVLSGQYAKTIRALYGLQHPKAKAQLCSERVEVRRLQVHSVIRQMHRSARVRWARNTAL
jgi:hypothetical protein